MSKWNFPLLLPGNPTAALEATPKQYVDTAVATRAPLASPSLTGVPTAPTATAGTNTTQIATTQFVRSEVGNLAPSLTGAGASGTWGISVTGNAGTATALQTSRNFSIGGELTAAAIGFTGAGNVALSATINNGVVTLAKMANLAANSIIGNNTGTAAAPVALSGAQVAALLPNFNTTAAGLVPTSPGGTTAFLRADGTWAVPAGGGGGGSPGGTTGQVQFNNAGAFDGAARVSITNGHLVLNFGSSPTSAPASSLALYTESIGGRMMLKMVGPSGLDTTLQPHTGRNKVSQWLAAGNSTTITAVGAAAMTATGTATTVNVAATNIYTRIRRVEYLVTTAAATAVAGWRYGAAMWTVGAGGNLGGFHLIVTFGNATGAATATNRMFVGMQGSTAAPTDVEPSTLTNILGVGWGAADANMRFFHNDGSGTASAIDLGSNFPVPTTDRSVGWELLLFAPPGGGIVYYKVINISTGNTTEGSVTTGLPTATTFLAPRGWMSVGGTSSVIGIALASCYIDTDF